jgi:hypothetical protein
MPRSVTKHKANGVKTSMDHGGDAAIHGGDAAIHEGDAAIRVDDLNHQGYSPNSSTTLEYRRRPTPLHAAMAGRRVEQQQKDSAAPAY